MSQQQVLRRLTVRDLQNLIRQLSDESLYDMTSVTNPSLWNVLRRALFVYAIMSGDTYDDGFEASFFSDFMSEIDTTQTGIKTMLGERDQHNYDTFFAELSALKMIAADSCLINVRQLFDPLERYIGAQFICSTPSPLLDYFWVCVTDDWQATVTKNIHEVRKWAEALSPVYTYIAYGKTSAGWTQALVGNYVRKNAL